MFVQMAEPYHHQHQPHTNGGSTTNLHEYPSTNSPSGVPSFDQSSCLKQMTTSGAPPPHHQMNYRGAGDPSRGNMMVNAHRPQSSSQSYQHHNGDISIPKNHGAGQYNPHQTQQHAPPPAPTTVAVQQQQRHHDYDMLCQIIQEWNANRLDLFELTLPNQNLEFHGVMRFYYQSQDDATTKDSSSNHTPSTHAPQSSGASGGGGKVATKCIRVSSTSTTSQIIDILIEKFRPDMKMLQLPQYALYEIHEAGERMLCGEEKPLLVQLNWHNDDREGRFLLRRIDEHVQIHPSQQHGASNTSLNEDKNDSGDLPEQHLKRKLSKREKKALKKKEKMEQKNQSNNNNNNEPNKVAEKLYNEVPDNLFTRSISNPEAVMRRRRQQKLEKRLQAFRSKDGGPDTGGTLKIFGESITPRVPYKTLLLSVGDNAKHVVEEMLDKYGKERSNSTQYCLVVRYESSCLFDSIENVKEADGGSSKGDSKSVIRQFILQEVECPLAILMGDEAQNFEGNISFHVKTRKEVANLATFASPPHENNTSSSTANANRNVKKTQPLCSDVNNTNYPPPFLIELMAPQRAGQPPQHGSRFLIPVNCVTEIGTDSSIRSSMSNHLWLSPGPMLFPRHCLMTHTSRDGSVSLTPSNREAETFVNERRIFQTTLLTHGCIVRFGSSRTFRYINSQSQRNQHNTGPSQTDSQQYDRNSLSSSSMSSSTASSPLSHKYKGSKQRGEQRPPSSSGAVGSVVNVRNPASEHILPAVLEFKEENEIHFFNAITVNLFAPASCEPENISFKLAPTFTIYMATRFRASTHYRPELVPEERAVRLTQMLNDVAELILTTIQSFGGGGSTKSTPSTAFSSSKALSCLSFWMSNASELLHFLKADIHVTSFSVQAQDILAESVHLAFKHLVLGLHDQLRGFGIPQMLNENVESDDISGVMEVLTCTMNVLRKCRVNAALTIQLFSQIFHFINMMVFNKLILYPAVGGSSSESLISSPAWAYTLKRRLSRIGEWAERQGLEIAADCHLARLSQAAHLVTELPNIESGVKSAGDVFSVCFKLNSLQVQRLVECYKKCGNSSSSDKSRYGILDDLVRIAESTVDEMVRSSEGRDVALEEDAVLQLPFLVPEDGYMCDSARGFPSGLRDFIFPLQSAGLCHMTIQPTSSGFWTIYMDSFMTQHAANNPSRPSFEPPSMINNNPSQTRQIDPEVYQNEFMPNNNNIVRSNTTLANIKADDDVILVTLNKPNMKSGLGLSIVAAPSSAPGGSQLGIYVKAVVAGGVADLDGRLQPGDQLLRVDGTSLLGVSQEEAAQIMVQTKRTSVQLQILCQAAQKHQNLASIILNNNNNGPTSNRSSLPHSQSIGALYADVNKNRNVANSHQVVGNNIRASQSTTNIMMGPPPAPPPPNRVVLAADSLGGPIRTDPLTNESGDGMQYYNNFGSLDRKSSVSGGFSSARDQLFGTNQHSGVQQTENRSSSVMSLSQQQSQGSVVNGHASKVSPQKSQSPIQQQLLMNEDESKSSQNQHSEATEEDEEDVFYQNVSGPTSLMLVNTSTANSQNGRVAREMGSPRDNLGFGSNHSSEHVVQTPPQQLGNNKEQQQQQQQLYFHATPRIAGSTPCKAAPTAAGQDPSLTSKQQREGLSSTLRTRDHPAEKSSFVSNSRNVRFPENPHTRIIYEVDEEEEEEEYGEYDDGFNNFGNEHLTTTTHPSASIAEQRKAFFGDHSENVPDSTSSQNDHQHATTQHVIDPSRRLDNLINNQSCGVNDTPLSAESEILEELTDDDILDSINTIVDTDDKDEGEIDSYQISNEYDIKRSKAVEIKENADKFLSEAESMLESSTMAFEKLDINSSNVENRLCSDSNSNAQLHNTPSVIGSQEVYRDPRAKRLLEKAAEEEERRSAGQSTPNSMMLRSATDGAKLSFKEKMQLFASQSSAPSTSTSTSTAVRSQSHFSKAQRDINSDDLTSRKISAPT